jgi:adenylate kinase
MRVICTGISGTDRLDWLRQVVERARTRGIDVVLYDVRETMFGIARAVGEPVEEETILDMFPRALVLLRAAALEQICSAIAADPGRDWVLNTHAVFRWKNTLISGFDPHYLARLDPHLFVTVTSSIRTAHARLREQPRWSQLSQEDLLVWREEEQFFTEEMARIHRKPQILLPRTIGLEACYRLLFEPTSPRVYLSYPMQHVVPGEERGLATFKDRLSQRFVVFDPADVNVMSQDPAATVPVHESVPEDTVTSPAGVPAPGETAATEYCTATVSPTTEGSGSSDVIVVVVSAFETPWLSVSKEVVKLSSPEYVAVRVFDPAEVDVTSQPPSATGAEQPEPPETVTVPVGVPAPGELTSTVH